jgi:hypothetical protein
MRTGRGGGRQRNTLRDANREETRRRNVADSSSSKNASKTVSARPLEPDEPCPICYDPMTDNAHGVRRLVHCGEGMRPERPRQMPRRVQSAPEIFRGRADVPDVPMSLGRLPVAPAETDGADRVWADTERYLGGVRRVSGVADPARRWI